MCDEQHERLSLLPVHIFVYPSFRSLLVLFIIFINPCWISFYKHKEIFNIHFQYWTINCLFVAKPSQWNDSAAMIIVIDVLTGVKKRTVVIVVVLLLHQDFLGQ